MFVLRMKQTKKYWKCVYKWCAVLPPRADAGGHDEVERGGVLGSLGLEEEEGPLPSMGAGFRV